MSAPKGHVHVSEREPGSWVDCEWTSGVMFSRAMFSKDINPTLVEAHHLRTAAGALPGGATAKQLQRGIKERYSHDTKVVSGIPTLALGEAAAIQGSMGAFPKGHQLRRWDPAFAGTHCVFIAKTDSKSHYWWDDPLAPSGTGYNGQWVAASDVERFIKGMSGAAHVVTATEVPSMTPRPITSESPATMDVSANTAWYDLDGTSKLAVQKSAYSARFTPYQAGDKRAMYASLDGVRRIVLVSPTPGTVRPPDTAPDTTPYSQADVDNAVKAIKAKAHVTVSFE